MKIKRIRFILLLTSPVILFLSFILMMHYLAFSSGLPGYRGGPMDAFRHTLASAYVSRYMGAWAVEAFTEFTEDDQKSNYDLMDIHNNRIGKNIGLGSGPIYDQVWKAVQKGEVDAQDPQTIRWLPENKWVSLKRLLFGK